MAIALPNGGLIARISTTYWSDWMPGPARRSIAPDIQSPLSSADYFAGRDPAMDTIVRFPEVTQFGDVLGHLLRVGAGTNTIERLYYQRKTDPLWADKSTEQSMQRIGAQLVSAKSYKDALLVFEINFRDYPSSLLSALQTVREAQASNRHDAGLDELANTLAHLKQPLQRH